MSKKTACFLALLLIVGSALTIKSGAAAVKAKVCQCVEYTRSATGIQIYGNANQWDNNAKSYGYRLSSVPVVGGVVNFEAGAYGGDKLYGHVAKVTGYRDAGKYWTVQVRHANWPGSTFTDLGCSNVSDKTFTILKGDTSVHYITR